MSSPSGGATWRSGPRQALEYVFDVEAPRGETAGMVEDYLSPFPVVSGDPSGTVQAHYRIEARGEDSVDVSVDGERFGDSVDHWRGVALLGWHLNQSVVERSKDRFTLMHAAAAARDGCAVLLPAPMENGKTTTVTGLLRAGYSYLTDEAAALDPTTLRLTAYPKPLTIDRGSWPLFPDLRPDGPERGGSWWVPAERIRAGCTLPGADLGLVVMPAYRRDEPTELRPLGQSESVLRLAESCFAFMSDGARNLAVLADLVRRVPVYELTIGDLDSAVAAIDGLVTARLVAA